MLVDVITEGKPTRPNENEIIILRRQCELSRNIVHPFANYSRPDIGFNCHELVSFNDRMREPLQFCTVKMRMRFFFFMVVDGNICEVGHIAKRNIGLTGNVLKPKRIKKVGARS